MTDRAIEKIVAARPVSDGAGVRLKRLIGTPELDHVDPFLLFDAFGSERGADYIKGFPDHPHRGIETVTYMLAGRMRHADNKGNSGELGPGDVQWMTAGRGIVHSEMPLQEDGLMRGFQIWVNLPGRHKMMPPRYQDVAAAAIPTVEAAAGVCAKVIAGRLAGTDGAVRDILADPLYLDLHFAPGASVTLPIPAGHTAIVHTYDGDLAIGDSALDTDCLAILSDGSQVAIVARNEGAKALLLAARPWGEPIVRYGPFVMTTRQEIVEAVQDFRAGRF